MIVFVVKESWVIHFPIRPTPMLSVLYLRQRQHILAMVNLQIYLRVSPHFESQCMTRLARLAVARRGLLHAVRGGGLPPHHAVPGPPGHHGQVAQREPRRRPWRRRAYTHLHAPHTASMHSIRALFARRRTLSPTPRHARGKAAGCALRHAKPQSLAHRYPLA